MQVLRQVEMNVDSFRVGDQITLEISGYGKFTATVQKVDDGLVLFFFDQCITSRPMNEHRTDKNGYIKNGFAESDLCEWMNSELLAAFPYEILSRIASFDVRRGVVLRIPTRGEMFGQDKHPFYDSDKHEQLPLMKDRENRICTLPNDECVQYWLWNERRVRPFFALVDISGNEDYNGASYNGGVRPVFCIRDKKNQTISIRYLRKVMSATAGMPIDVLDYVKIIIEECQKNISKMSDEKFMNYLNSIDDHGAKVLLWRMRIEKENLK